MAAFPGPEVPLAKAQATPDPDDVTLFARIEGLVGEEEALLRRPAHERDQHHHDRLREIADELDRIFAALSARARRLASAEE
jgi:hypothetical protein